MRRALIKYDSVNAGVLTETDQGEYVFEYLVEYIEKYGQQFICLCVWQSCLIST
ncbi:MULTISPECIES: hypothetical protein [Myroides]|uniref:Uncharacterized protein n=1 Tax=Myroides odoratimimus CCUG 10230 TaxID=883150 RepID=A0ABP2NE48_9FLAO|nr:MULTISPECIES: hypothetical protein [Myroides]AJA68693.1 hypothetical protein MYRA21_1538 [Myroides sp. A21]EHO11152.1 hypothetical protein HMPREF9712_00809 [Myroides odoratimimus CCUG 10230]EHO14207.1 hypothetical protein HMPREF9714_00469 [Myroides odoratimimus CCUG 12901]MCO7724165.1 hypothetical protein [Myroides odoratimimus]MDM1033098.1 hypothetical protein [Myroides odoratimimus]